MPFSKHIFIVIFGYIFMVNLFPVYANNLTPSVSNISDKGSATLYNKFEISFSVATSAGNPYFYYDPERKKIGGISDTNPNYDGVTVNAVFRDPDGEEFIQPAFYFQQFEEDNANDWIYPLKKYEWRVRFSPNKTGIWSYKIIVQDKNGIFDTSINGDGWHSFMVTESKSHGFLRVSKKDSRYFEFDDGTFFPGLGYNENYRGIDWIYYYTKNKPTFETMGKNGIQFIRMWLSQWGIYGAEWTPWKFYEGNAYLQKHRLRSGVSDKTGLNVAPINSEISLELEMSSTDTSNACIMNNWETAPPAIHGGKDYHIQVRYRTEEIKGARMEGKPYGLVVKTGGWLWGREDSQKCWYPGTGTVVTNYASENTQDAWSILEGTIHTKNGDRTLDRLHIVLENVNDGARAYIDNISVREVLPDGTYGANIIEKPNFNHHLYIDQRNAYAFDKVLELAEANNVYLRLVLSEKNDEILSKMDDNGELHLKESRNNDYFYGNFREETKTRWLLKNWWRYAQARWGYSTSIHSWELLNEGDTNMLGNGRHQILADEMGKYLHCEVFGIPAGEEEHIYKCPSWFDHPNDHMVSTSHWNSTMWRFWANKHPKFTSVNTPDERWSFFNIDFGDVHKYEDSNPLTSTGLDTALSTYKTGESMKGIGKPAVRGETAFSDSVLSDTQGIWLHNFIWGQINAYGLYDAGYWQNGYDHIYNGSSRDYRALFLPFYTFIKSIPLNNGNYKDSFAEVTNNNLRVWGQKDTVLGNAHLWIQNKAHTWKNIVDKVAISPESGEVKLCGFDMFANTGFILEKWDTYMGKIQSSSTLNIDGEGCATISITNLNDDVAYKIKNPSQPTPTSPLFLKGDINNDRKVDMGDLSILLSLFGTNDALADINSDDKVDITDLSILLLNFGKII